MQRHSHLLTLCGLLFLAAATADRGDRSAVTSHLGEWEPITDLKDLHVREIGEFAVKEYNRQSNQLKDKLKLKSILKGEKQVALGINYRLVLETTDESEGGAVKNYLAVVHETANKHRKLTSFKPLLKGAAPLARA